jgi:hypothetical protein
VVIASIACVRPLDTEVVASRRRVADVNVVHVRAREQTLDLHFHAAAINVNLLAEYPAVSIPAERQRISPQFCGKATILRVALALILMDKDGTRERKRLQRVEGIVGEQNTPLSANPEGAEAMPARTVSSGYLNMGGVPVKG